MSEAGTLIGIAVYSVLSFVSALASLPALIGGALASLAAQRRVLLVSGGFLAVVGLWLQKPELFEVIDTPAALAMTAGAMFLAGLAWAAMSFRIRNWVRSAPRKGQ